MNAALLVLNAGSSSLKFAVFGGASGLDRVAAGAVERVGRSDATLRLVVGGNALPPRDAPGAHDHAASLGILWDEIPRHAGGAVAGVAHRIVHGGPEHCEPQLITPQLRDDLRRMSPFDPEHLPPELALVDSVSRRAPDVPQIACFDTAFHRTLPRVARILPLPRRYEAAGIHRYGFHGLSYQYLLEELMRIGDPAARGGRVVLAHLGNGASLAAVRDGRCIDTSMAFTPTAGIVMSTRTGDLDPGLAAYLAAAEGMTVAQFQRLVNHKSGLLGISETTGDMRELLARESTDERAAEAVAVFCYQTRKWIGSYAAALGGLDTLVFAGGIGENCPAVRARICAGMEFLGLTLNADRNDGNAGLVSTNGSRVAVRVIHTDEELMIARAARPLLERGQTTRT